MSNMTIDASAKPQIFAKKQIFLDNFLSISDSMDVAKDNVAGVWNNYLKDHQFLCKMSPNEIVGISAYMVEKV